MQTDNIQIQTSFSISKPTNLITSLKENCPGLTSKQLKMALQNGAIWVSESNRKPKRSRRAKRELKIGNEVYVYYNQSIIDSTPPNPSLIADLGQYSIWHKPRGMLSQGSKWADHHTLTRWVEMNHFTQRQSFLIHRLDRATSGLMLVGHSKKAAQRLSDLFENRLICKKYLAIVSGKFQADTMTINSPIEGRQATTIINLVKHQNKFSLLDIEIQTGRKHQIRKHLSEHHFPIVGDRLYSHSENQTSDHDLQLTCYHLSYSCPFKKKKLQWNLDPSLHPNIDSL